MLVSASSESEMKRKLQEGLQEVGVCVRGYAGECAGVLYSHTHVQVSVCMCERRCMCRHGTALTAELSSSLSGATGAWPGLVMLGQGGCSWHMAAVAKNEELKHPAWALAFSLASTFLHTHPNHRLPAHTSPFGAFPSSSPAVLSL